MEDLERSSSTGHGDFMCGAGHRACGIELPGEGRDRVPGTLKGNTISKAKFIWMGNRTCPCTTAAVMTLLRP